MKNGWTINTDSLFNTAAYSQEFDSWSFLFDNEIAIYPSKFWRLYKNNEIIFVSFDNGHQFGLPAPIDLEVELKKILHDKKLIEICVQKNTGDLSLLLSDEIKIDIYITSAGYETYEFCISNKRYIGCGAGHISIVDNQ